MNFIYKLQIYLTGKTLEPSPTALNIPIIKLIIRLAMLIYIVIKNPSHILTLKSFIKEKSNTTFILDSDSQNINTISIHTIKRLNIIFIGFSSFSFKINMRNNFIVYLIKIKKPLKP